MSSIPENFKPLALHTGFNEVLQPLYIKYTKSELVLGMQITERHLNRLSICHGGVYMTLMDFAANAALCHHLGRFIAAPTVNFSLDFMASAKLGDFIWGDIQLLKQTRTLSFTQGFVRCGDKVLARSNAIFKIPDQSEHTKGLSVEEFVQRYSG